MRSRRAVLLALFGTAAVLMAGRWGWTTFIAAPLERQSKAVANAEKKMKATHAKVIAARAARANIDDWAGHALPAQPSAAQEQYQGYLIDLLRQAQIRQPSITPGQPTQRNGVYMVPFSVQAETDMSAFARFLHLFYSADRLHQIRRLSLNPIEGPDKGQGIRCSLVVEALGIEGSEGGAVEPMPPRVLPTLEAYQAVSGSRLLATRGGSLPLSANDPEHVVLTGIVRRAGDASADVYDQAANQTRSLRVGDACAIGPVRGNVLDLGYRDMVLLIEDGLWQWSIGTPFSSRRSLTLEQALDREILEHYRSHARDGSP